MFIPSMRKVKQYVANMSVKLKVGNLFSQLYEFDNFRGPWYRIGRG